MEVLRSLFWVDHCTVWILCVGCDSMRVSLQTTIDDDDDDGWMDEITMDNRNGGFVPTVAVIVLTVVLIQSNIGAFCTDARLNDNLKVKKLLVKGKERRMGRNQKEGKVYIRRGLARAGIWLARKCQTLKKSVSFSEPPVHSSTTQQKTKF